MNHPVLIPMPPIWLLVCTSCDPNVVLCLGHNRPTDSEIEEIRLVHGVTDHNNSAPVFKLVQGLVQGLIHGGEL